MGLYTTSPEGSTVICGDEKGPVAAKLYPAKGQWAETGHRPHYQPDHGRRGYIWLFGALNPHTGEGLLYYGRRRDSASFTAFMDQVDRWLPEGEIHVVIDNLSIHDSVETLLWNFGHPRFYFHFLPTAAAWLNLIEGWWRIISHRALDGRNFQGTAGLERAFDITLAGWNEKPTPFRWNPSNGRMASVGSVCDVPIFIVTILLRDIHHYLANRALRSKFNLGSEHYSQLSILCG